MPEPASQRLTEKAAGMASLPGFGKEEEGP
jgi:hypothetical protein